MSGTSRPVVLSLEDDESVRCIDIIAAEDGFRFKEFRRDPEDGGRWSLVRDYSDRVFVTRDEALQAAAESVTWFRWPE